MNKTTEALKLADEALDMVTSCDYGNARERDLYQEALAAIREALAEPVKQEPVAWRCVIPRRTWTLGIDWGREYFEDESEITGLQGVEPLYAAPVDSKAIRAEALEEAAKVCDAIEEDRWNLYKGRKPYTGNEAGRADPHEQGVSMGAGDCAAAIRELK